MRGKRKQLEYERLVLVYSDELFRFAMWLCKDVAMAEDLVQESCLRAWKSLDSLRDSTSSKAWLMTILRNEYARQFSRFRPDMADVELDLIGTQDIDNDTSVEAFALKQALNELAEEYREPLLLQVIGGLSCEEIAVACNITKSAAMTRLFRAKQKMREVLEPAKNSEKV